MSNPPPSTAQQLALVMRLNACWYWRQDADLRFISVAHNVSTTGIGPSFFLGKTRWELPNLMPAIFWDKHREITQNHQPFSDLEYEIRGKDGERDATRWISASGEPLFDSEGNFLGYHGFAQNTTRRKYAERLLHAREQRFIAIFDQSPVGMVEWDRDFYVTAWNAAAERIFGWSRAEVLGQHARRFTSPEFHAALDHSLQSRLHQPTLQKNVGKNMHKSGRHLVCTWTNALLRDEQGQVIGLVSMVEDLTEQTNAANRIEHLARHDALTNLPNRTYLLKLLDAALQDSLSTERPLAVMVVNMDRFKLINDSLGHGVGDHILHAVAQRLRDNTPGNTVARLGGDEFAVLMTHHAGAMAVQQLGHMLHTVLRLPYEVEHQEVQCTPSIGIALFPGDGETALGLLQSADSAMTYAKAQGRNNLQFFTVGLKLAAEERKALELDLRNAVRRGELVLHYQPQVDAHTGAMRGVEALVRWQHPTRGLIGPIYFIPIAEETGLINAIGSWVLNEACRTLRSWQDSGIHGVVMSVNLSALQLRHTALVHEVTAVLLNHGLSGTQLELELTESVAMADPEATIAILHRLRALGVMLAIDDFGTGYSSLSYLKLLPIQRLKLDRSFVMEIESAASDAAICSATIALAHKLKLGVVAEGVETEAQWQYLRHNGCETLQGFLFSKAIPADEAAQYARAHPVNPLIAI